VILLFCFGLTSVWGQETLVGWTFTSSPTSSQLSAGLSVTSYKNVLGNQTNQNSKLTTSSGSQNGAGSGSYFYANVTGAVGQYYEIEFSSLGYNNIHISSSQTANNANRLKYIIEYSINGGSFIEAVSEYSITSTTASSPNVQSFNLIPANNQASVKIRWRCTSLTGGSATSRIGLISVKGIEIPIITSYSVTYNGNGADGGTEPIDNHEYDKDEEVTVLGNTFTKTGYTFTDWNTQADGEGDSFEENSTFLMPANDVTLYAQWAINTYTVTYDGNGGNGAAPDDGNSPYNHGSTVTVSNQGDLVREGHTFIGWTTVVNDVTSLVTTFEITSDVTLYAFWEDASKLDQTITFAELADVTYGDVFELSAFSDSGLDIT
jgi:uncharacterized repeat protein (TIGR02543 family)